MADNLFKGFEGRIEIESPIYDDNFIQTGTVKESIGRINSLSVEITNNVSSITELGSRFPVETKEGSFEVSGSLSKAIINKAQFEMAVCRAGTSKVPTGKELGQRLKGPLHITCILQDSVSEDNKMINATLVNVYFDSWSMDISTDEVILENIDYIAETITFS